MSADRHPVVTRSQLEGEIVEWMREPAWRADDARFERLALALFARQLEDCAPYRRFCEARGADPSSVRRASEIPAVPTGAFKEVALRCFPKDETIKTFRTSGTSDARRGALHLDTLELYEASLLASLRTLLFPDVHARDAESGIEMRILAPSAEEAPDSSLSHMFAVLVAALGAAGSAFDVKDGELDVDALVGALARAEQSERPLALCGTAFAFVHLLEGLEARALRFALPRGSRAMETGGFKGRSRALTREALHGWMADRLGLPQQHIVNQYGMTELGSQFYDSVQIDPEGPRRKLGPPWARVRVVDPESGEDAPAGDTGMLVIHDLANTGSIAAIETADLGRLVLDSSGTPIGFEVLGRAPGAEERGCSIAADVMLSEGGRSASPR